MDNRDKNDMHPDDFEAFRVAFLVSKEMGTHMSPIDDGLRAYEQNRRSRLLFEADKANREML